MRHGPVQHCEPEDAPAENAEETIRFRHGRCRHPCAWPQGFWRIDRSDPNLAIAGLTDFTVRIHELARNPRPVERIFLVENEITGLAFAPYTPGSLVFFTATAVSRARDRFRCNFLFPYLSP